MPTNPFPTSHGRYLIINLPRHNRVEELKLDKCARKGCSYARRIDSIYCIECQGTDLTDQTHNDLPAQI